MRPRREHYPALLDTSANRLVHQVWFDLGKGPDPVGPEFLEARSSVDRYLAGSGWVVVQWDEEGALELLSELYPGYLAVYRGYPHAIQRVDAVRYFALHAFGGWYADMDYHATRSWRALDDWLEPARAYFVESCHGLLGRHVSNALMFADRHPSVRAFLKSKLLDQLGPRSRPSWWHTRHVFVMQSTGPGLVSDAYSAARGRVAKKLPRPMFNPCSACDSGRSCARKIASGSVFAYHGNCGSWEDSDSGWALWFYCRSRQVWAAAVASVVLLLLALAAAVAARRR